MEAHTNVTVSGITRVINQYSKKTVSKHGFIFSPNDFVRQSLKLVYYTQRGLLAHRVQGSKHGSDLTYDRLRANDLQSLALFRRLDEHF